MTARLTVVELPVLDDEVRCWDCSATASFQRFRAFKGSDLVVELVCAVHAEEEDT